MHKADMAVIVFCGILAALYVGGYLWPPLSLAAAVAFLILGALAGFVPGKSERDDHKIGGTDC